MKVKYIAIVTLTISLLAAVMIIINWVYTLGEETTYNSAIAAFKNDKDFKVLTDERFSNLQIITFYDKRTKVQYMYVRNISDGSKSGGPSVMYNADGTVMLYEGD